MTHFVALLRGINVNGITIKMADLAATFQGLGHTGVKTVLASGNVLFEAGGSQTAEPNAAAIKAEIETALSTTYGYDAWIVLVARETLAAVVQAYPFDAEREGWHPYVVFGSDKVTLNDLAAHGDGLDPSDERVKSGDQVIYWEVRRAVGVKSPFSKLSAKARYRSTTTTRNLRTLHKLL